MTAAQTALDFTGPACPEPARRRQRIVERDRTLEALQLGRRREVIALAHQVAVELAASNACAMPSWLIPNGCVTAPQVLDEMRRRGRLSAEEAADTRWIGGALNPKRWERVGFSTAVASKGRPCAVWRPMNEGRADDLVPTR